MVNLSEGLEWHSFWVN